MERSFRFHAAGAGVYPPGMRPTHGLAFAFLVPTLALARPVVSRGPFTVGTTTITWTRTSSSTGAPRPLATVIWYPAKPGTGTAIGEDEFRDAAVLRRHWPIVLFSHGSCGIPEQFRDLFAKKAFANLATVGRSGTPQVTPVWVDFDGTHVRFNTAKGRVKTKNLARNPRVALAIQDPDNPYRYVQVRGRIVEATEQGADAHIDALARKYLGQDRYPWRGPGEVRVMYKVLPESVQGM